MGVAMGDNLGLGFVSSLCTVSYVVDRVKCCGVITNYILLKVEPFQKSRNALELHMCSF